MAARTAICRDAGATDAYCFGCADTAGRGDDWSLVVGPEIFGATALRSFFGCVLRALSNELITAEQIDAARLRAGGRARNSTPPHACDTPEGVISVTRLRAALLWCVACAGAVAGCNVIFGITGGESAGSTGQGGSVTGSAHASVTGTGGSGSSGSGGACAIYDGDGTTSWMPLDGGANLGATSFHNGGSVDGSYDGSGMMSHFRLGGTVDGFCGAGAEVYFAGMPAAGTKYTVVDRAGFMASAAFIKGPNVYVEAGAQVMLDGGGCEAKPREFGSIAGMGTASIVSAGGTHVAFTVSGVRLTGLMDSMFDGQGTIELDINAHADCFVIK